MRYSVLLQVTGIPHFPEGISDEPFHYTDVVNWLKEKGLPFSESEPGESEYDYLADEWSGGSRDLWGRDSGFWALWKEKVQDLQFADILDQETFDELVDLLGAFADTTETLGTLGGPLGPCLVPDIPFPTEARFCITTLRVTPFYGDDRDNVNALPGLEEEVAHGIFTELRDQVIEKYEL